MPFILLLRDASHLRALSLENPLTLYLDGETFYRNGQELRLAFGPRQLLSCLAANENKIISYQELIESLYYADPDGGPDDPKGVISIYSHRLRPRIARLGLLLETHWGIGYCCVDLLSRVPNPQQFGEALANG